MNTQITISTYKFDDSELEVLIEELNKIISDNDRIMENVYQADIFTKKYMGELEKLFPEILKIYNDVAAKLQWLAKYTGLELKNSEVEVDNPYLQNSNDEVKPQQTETETKDIKQLYRKICTLTHPDKVKSPILNKYFLSAKKLYKKGDYKELHKIYELVIIECEKSSPTRTSEDAVLLVKQRISSSKEDNVKFNNLLFSIKLSPTYIIATTFSQEDTRNEGIQLFLKHTDGIINHMYSQIHQIETILKGA